MIRMKYQKKPSDTAARRGLHHLINSPASPLTHEGLQAFRLMKKASGLSVQETLEHIGKRGSQPEAPTETEKAKQEARLEKLNP
jgi:hypothetical protein